MSTQAGGRYCLPYSIEVSPLLDALVLIGSNFTLSLVFSVSKGEVRPPYILLPTMALPGVGPWFDKKVLFKGLNLKTSHYDNHIIIKLLTCLGGHTPPDA